MRSDFELKPERRKFVEDKVSTWAFSAHDFTDDELLYAALVMLQHALSAPELSQWDMTQGKVCSAMSRPSADLLSQMNSSFSFWQVVPHTTNSSSTTTSATSSTFSRPCSTSWCG